MLDQMSYEPGPSVNGATTEVYNEIVSTYHIPNPVLLKKLVKNKAQSLHDKYGSLGSLAGWVTFSKNDIMKTALYNYKAFLKKKRIVLISLRFKCFLISHYIKTIENIYKPGGIFETETAKETRWASLVVNPITELPPPPPPIFLKQSPYLHYGQIHIDINKNNLASENSDSCVLCWKYICSICDKGSNTLMSCQHCDYNAIDD